MEYKLIKTYSYQSDILTIKPLLESKSIRFELKDQNTILIDPFLSNSIGGIKLLVHPEDYQNAILCLAIDKFGYQSYSNDELINLYSEYLKNENLKMKQSSNSFVFLAIVISVCIFIYALLLI